MLIGATGHLGRSGVVPLLVQVVCSIAELVFVVAAFHSETRAFLA